MFFHFSLEIVSSVSEGSDSVDVEWILTHTYSICFDFACWNVNFFVYFLAIVFDFLFQFLIIFLSSLLLHLLLLSKFFLHLKILAFIQWKNIASPFPLQVSFAICIWRIIEQTSRTNSVIDNSNRLESVGQDNVWIHGSNVQMIN